MELLIPVSNFVCQREVKYRVSLERDCRWYDSFKYLNFIFSSRVVVDSYCNNHCRLYCLIVKIIVENIYEGVKFSKPRVTIVIYFEIVNLVKKHLKSSRRRCKLRIDVVCCCVML